MVATKLSHKVLGVGFSGYVCLIHETIGAISKPETEWFSARRRQQLITAIAKAFLLSSVAQKKSTNYYCF